MTGGMLAYIFEAQNVIRETGVTFDEAMEIVKAAHEPKPERADNRRRAADAPLETNDNSESNVIYGVDFLNKKPKGETIGAL